MWAVSSFSQQHILSIQTTQAFSSVIMPKHLTNNVEKSLLRLRYDEIYRSKPTIRLARQADWNHALPYDGVSMLVADEMKATKLTWSPRTIRIKPGNVWTIAVKNRAALSKDQLIAERSADKDRAEEVLEEMTDRAAIRKIRSMLGLDIIQNFDNGPLGGRMPDDVDSVSQRRTDHKRLANVLSKYSSLNKEMVSMYKSLDLYHLIETCYRFRILYPMIVPRHSMTMKRRSI